MAMGLALGVGLILLAIVIAGGLVMAAVARIRQAKMAEQGGALVKGGTFLNLRSWEFITVPRPAGPLPGTEGQVYLRVPTVLALFFGPLVGLLFVILFPLVGVGALLIALGMAVYLPP